MTDLLVRFDDDDAVTIRVEAEPAAALERVAALMSDKSATVELGIKAPMAIKWRRVRRVAVKRSGEDRSTEIL